MRYAVSQMRHNLQYCLLAILMWLVSLESTGGISIGAGDSISSPCHAVMQRLLELLSTRSIASRNDLKQEDLQPANSDPTSHVENRLGMYNICEEQCHWVSRNLVPLFFAILFFGCSTQTSTGAGNPLLSHRSFSPGFSPQRSSGSRQARTNP